MTIVDRTFISFKTKIKKIIASILIRGLRSKIHHFDEYVVLTFYMKEVLPDDHRVFAQIIRKIHIVDDLKIEMFIEIDILISKRIIINFIIQVIKIDNYRNMAVLMNLRA